VKKSFVVALSVVAALTGSAQADNFPSRTISIIVPFWRASWPTG